MGQDQSSHDPPSPGRALQIDPEEAKRQIHRAKLRIQTFRVRAGSSEICSHLYQTWIAEKVRITSTWQALSDSARRGLIMNIREKVVERARILHTVVTTGKMSLANKTKLVRKLMEKVAFELFDTSVVYDESELLRFVEEILKNKGGGKEVPIGLRLEVEATFQPDLRRFSMVSLASKDGGSEEIEDEAVQQQLLSEGIPVETLPREAGGGIVTSRSANSLQGYYSNDKRKTARRNSGSKSIHRLLGFIPSSGIDPVSRKNLTLELLMEMRDAFLVHFSVLVFSELFEDSENVIHKYEYDSDSDTDIGQSETDIDEDDESSSGGDSP